MRQQLNQKMSKHKFKCFPKKERSSFPYWYYHWKAFNLVAYYLHCWRFKYLFHDIEKPWLKLFLSYDQVQRLHRKNNSHHLDYKKGIDNIDWLALIIDNESCRFTKADAQLNSREFIEILIISELIDRKTSKKCLELLDKLGL